MASKPASRSGFIRPPKTRLPALLRNNNDYEVNSVSPLALQHGDSSVLERHHVFATYQVGAHVTSWDMLLCLFSSRSAS